MVDCCWQICSRYACVCQICTRYDPSVQIRSSEQIWSISAESATRTYLRLGTDMSRWTISVNMGVYKQAGFLLMCHGSDSLFASGLEPNLSDLSNLAGLIMPEKTVNNIASVALCWKFACRSLRKGNNRYQCYLYTVHRREV